MNENTSNAIAGKVVVITGASRGLCARRQPDEGDINEIVFRPTSQEL